MGFLMRVANAKLCYNKKGVKYISKYCVVFIKTIAISVSTYLSILRMLGGNKIAGKIKVADVNVEIGNNICKPVMMMMMIRENSHLTSYHHSTSSCDFP